MSDFTVHDWLGREVTVGMTVLVGDAVAAVEVITDPDGDADDEGRQFGINPKVGVRYMVDEDVGGIHEFFSTRWAARGWWDDDAPYVCDEVEVVP